MVRLVLMLDILSASARSSAARSCHSSLGISHNAACGASIRRRPYEDYTMGDSF